MSIENYLHTCQERINEVLDQLLPTTQQQPQVLHQAMRYAVLNGGKRLRSALIYATGESVHANKKILDRCCAAVELVHAFSLVHDDLPALDNDDLRRGKPSCHKKFGEAIAILTGDALLALAFEVMTQFSAKQLDPSINLRMISILSHYIGSHGVAGGEALDILEDKSITLQKLAVIYKMKTSYLICASILLGIYAANCNDKKIITNLEKFGLYLGMAFQIHDDIIGIESSSATLGKPQGSDSAKAKPIFPALLGMAGAKKKEQEYLALALKHLKKSGIAGGKLIALTDFVAQRNN